MTEPYILFDNGPSGNGVEAFSDPEAMIVAWQMDEVEGALAAMSEAQMAGKWLAGYASYELGYCLEPKLQPLLPENRDTPLMCFGVFDGPDAAKSLGIGLERQSQQLDVHLDPLVPRWSEDQYVERFTHVLDYINAGDIYQANLTFPIETIVTGTALGLHGALTEGQRAPFGAVMDFGVGPAVISRSPELFFRTSADGVIETRPMKGTAPRGSTPDQDRLLRDTLQADAKNRAENLMIVDLLRNDISRISKVGSVKVPELFRIESYATVHQMVSYVQAQLLDDNDLASILRALFPCGSITGAPKIRSMEILRELEPDPRGIYCGGIGWAAPDGRSEFNVAIRTVSLFVDGPSVKRRARLNVGGGVVYDSTGPSEYEEALWKARYMTLVQKT